MYSLLWKAARPLLRRHKRLRENFAERLAPPAWPHSPAMQAAGAVNPLAPGRPCSLWLQAASGGEAYLAWELLKVLAARAPGLPVLCTTCTRQGLEVLHKAQQDQSCAALPLAVNYLPLDEKAVTRRALVQAFGPTINPAPDKSADTTAVPPLLVLLETEIWPGLLSACAAAGVKSAIINARMTESSFKAYRLLRPWLRRLAPAAILSSAEDDLRRFCEIFDTQPANEKNNASERDSGLSPICSTRAPIRTPIRALMPNMKFDRLLPEGEESAALAAPAAALPPGGLLLLASTREEEESALLEVTAQLLAQAPKSALVLAPRHLHRVEAWREALGKAGLDYALRSGHGALAELPFRPGRLLLWDSFGELGSLYRLASAVFVGGSLAPLGGQNFLEPLSAGLVPCLGPHWSNFYWAGEQLFSQGLARRVAGATELAPALLELLRHPRPKEEVKREFAAYLAPRRGGSAQAAGLILRLLGREHPEAAHGC